MTKIIVCREKHGDYYWDASTPEAFAKSALAILTERFTQGWWYHNPDDDDGLGKSEWANKERKQNEIVLAMSKEQIDVLPDDAKRAVLRRRKETEQQLKENAEARDWYQAAKLVVENQSLATVTVGRGVWERQIPVAWRLLEERTDYEYESVVLESLLTGDKS